MTNKTKADKIKEQKEKESYRIAKWISVSTCIGITIGFICGNMVMAFGLGMLLGVLTGSIVMIKPKKFETKEL